MSETKHFKGKLTPTGKTLAEFDPGVDDLYDKYFEKAVEIKGMIYTVEKEEIYPCLDIFNATINNDGTIDFEVRYYNGGCGFDEAIDKAMKN